MTAELSLRASIAGVGPDLLIIVVAAFAVGEQPRAAAMIGFGAGLFRDLLLATPKGLGAFAYAVTSYAIGLVGPIRGVWAFVGVVAGATFVSQAVHGIGTIVIGPPLDVWTLARVITITTAYNAILAPLLMPLLSWITVRESTGSGVAAE